MTQTQYNNYEAYVVSAQQRGLAYMSPSQYLSYLASYGELKSAAVTPSQLPPGMSPTQFQEYMAYVNSALEQGNDYLTPTQYLSYVQQNYSQGVPTYNTGYIPSPSGSPTAGMSQSQYQQYLAYVQQAQQQGSSYLNPSQYVAFMMNIAQQQGQSTSPYLPGAPSQSQQSAQQQALIQQMILKLKQQNGQSGPAPQPNTPEWMQWLGVINQFGQTPTGAQVLSEVTGFTTDLIGGILGGISSAGGAAVNAVSNWWSGDPSSQCPQGTVFTGQDSNGDIYCETVSSSSNPDIDYYDEFGFPQPYDDYGSSSSNPDIAYYDEFGFPQPYDDYGSSSSFDDEFGFPGNFGSFEEFDEYGGILGGPSFDNDMVQI
jgi:hypothetical protein